MVLGTLFTLKTTLTAIIVTLSLILLKLSKDYIDEKDDED